MFLNLPQVTLEHDENEDLSSVSGTLDEDVATSQKHLRLYFNSLAKSGTVQTVADKFNLVTAKLGKVFKWQKFIINNKEFSG